MKATNSISKADLYEPTQKQENDYDFPAEDQSMLRIYARIVLIRCKCIIF